MPEQSPIYTAATECQDCYKCIRECPVKAIKVESGYACIVPELCVCCGHCVAICPNGAKKVRDDRRWVQKLLGTGKRMIVSLAPSFASEFPGATARQMVAALRRLGFWGVSETALGAQEVSAHLSRMLEEERPRLLLSPACPVIVDFIRRYRPEWAGSLAPVLSPMLAHAVLLRAEYGDDTGVAFIGPCIAKKREADARPDLIDAALTFEDLRAWMKDAGVFPERIEPAGDDCFIPRPAGEGALYPVEGGMMAGIRAAGARMMSFSGLPAAIAAIEGIEQTGSETPLFLELMACPGGCVNGPATAPGAGIAVRRCRVEDYAPRDPGPRAPSLAISCAYPADPVAPPQCTEAQIREVLRATGKQTPEDELNCGGCGYDSCRAFAAAFLAGRAERRMCVTYMRKLAEKKIHALMHKMPSAVVIVDENLRIVESNPNFAKFFGGEELEGALLDTVVPFYNLFQNVLRTGEEIYGREIRYRGSVFSVTVFTIEKNALIGGIFRDVTQPAVHKEQIIERTRQVIQKNLQTVQQIAYLLGENAAETEIALNSVVESFTPESVDEDDEPR